MGQAVSRRLAPAFPLGALLVLTLLAGTAQADTKSSTFDYGSDATNWYWAEQIEEEIAVGPIVQPVTLGNPQSPQTLPVAAQGGEPNKISALLIDLVSRGVEPGAQVSSFVFTIAEGTVDLSDPNQPDVQPPFNTKGKVIKACPIVGVWAGGDGAELWENAPEYDDASCVTGERKAEGGTGRWSFDLSTLAATWGEDPLANNGIMLVPEIEGNPATGGTWQINLQIPQRDDSETGVDEYEKTKSRVSVEIAYTPAAPDQPADPGDFTGDSGFGSGGSLPGGFGGGFGTGSNGITPSGGSQPGGPQQTPVAVRQPTPSMPQLPLYVWALIPVGLLLISTVRAVVLEPLATARTGGVIEAIRAKNAELRGMGTAPAGRRRFGPLRFRPALSVRPVARRALDAVADWSGQAWRRVRR
jgi:hypothetical protein